MSRPVFNVDPLPIPDDVDASAWPGATVAAKQLGMRPLQFKQLIREGGLKEYKAKDKSRRYDPDEIDALADKLLDNLGDQEDEEMTVGGKPIEGMRAATDLLKQAQGHNERLLTTAILGFEKAMTAMGNVVTALTEENSRLTQFKYEAISTLEKARTEEMAQALEANRLMAAEDRRQKLVAAIVPHIGPTLQKLGDAMQGFAPAARAEAPEAQPEPVASDALKDQALDLLRRLGPDKLRLAVSILDEEDQPLAIQVIDQLGKETPQCDCSMADPA